MTPLAIRNTPTGVGKTVRADGTRTDNRKHPHGCGEDTRLIPETVSKLETPPRVWGRLSNAGIKLTENRNTPTGVGKTYPATVPLSHR